MENKELYLVDVKDYTRHLGSSVILYKLVHELNRMAAALPANEATAAIKALADFSDKRAEAVFSKHGMSCKRLLADEVPEILRIAQKELIPADDADCTDCGEKDRCCPGCDYCDDEDDDVDDEADEDDCDPAEAAIYAMAKAFSEACEALLEFVEAYYTRS